MNYGRLPFWYDFNLSPATIMHALALVFIGADCPRTAGAADGGTEGGITFRVGGFGLQVR